MQLTVAVPIIVSMAGALMYGFSQGKASEIGRLCFGCGLLAFLLTMK